MALPPAVLKAKLIAERNAAKNKSNNGGAFETFVPAKSRSLGIATSVSLAASTRNCEEGDVMVSSSVVQDYMKNLYRVMSNNAGLTVKETSTERADAGSSSSAPAAAGKADKTTTATTQGVTASSLSALGGVKVAPSAIPHDSVMKGRIDIEANFDLRPLAISSGHECSAHPMGKNLPHHEQAQLQSYLIEWTRAQQSYVYPDRPISTLTKTGAVVASTSVQGHHVADLSHHDLWTEPRPDDTDVVSVVKGRRIKWQAAMCSALEQLIGPVEEDDASTDGMNSFYLLNSDADVVPDGAANIDGASCLPISAVFFRGTTDASSTGSSNNLNSSGGSSSSSSSSSRCSSTSSSSSSNMRGRGQPSSSPQHVSCIIIGAKAGFLNRLVELGAEVSQIVDSAELKLNLLSAKRPKQSKVEMSSAGRMEEKAAGVSVLLSGEFSVRVAVEAIMEGIFSTAKLLKPSMDVPKLIASVPFAHGVRQGFHATFVQCQHDFHASVGGTNGGRPRGNGSEQGAFASDETFSSSSSQALLATSASISSASSSAAVAGAAGAASSRLQHPVHRIVLVGLVWPGALRALARLLQTMATTTATATATATTRSHSHQPAAEGGSTWADLSVLDRRLPGSDHSFTFAMLSKASFDATFMHPKAAIFGPVAGLDREVSAVRSSGNAGGMGASAGSGTSASSDTGRLKIPMKFVTANIVKRNTALANGRTTRAKTDEVADQEVPEPTDGGETDDEEGYMLGAREWVERRRRRGRAFFVVRLSSSSRSAGFAYATPQTPLITHATSTMSTVPVAVSSALVGAVVGADDQPLWLHPSPNIAEIRWCNPRAGALMGNDDRVTLGGTAERTAVGLVRLSIAPKEAPLMVDDDRRTGVVLLAVNQYDIYAPETHADRERKAFRMSAVGR